MSSEPATKTYYREQSSRRFEQLCRLTGLSNTALAQVLKEKLSRETLTRQTLTGWRSGDQPVPTEAFYAALELAGPDALSFMIREFENDVAEHFARRAMRLASHQEGFSRAPTG